MFTLLLLTLFDVVEHCWHYHQYLGTLYSVKFTPIMMQNFHSLNTGLDQCHEVENYTYWDLPSVSYLLHLPRPMLYFVTFPKMGAEELVMLQRSSRIFFDTPLSWVASCYIMLYLFMDGLICLEGYRIGVSVWWGSLKLNWSWYLEAAPPSQESSKL